MGTFWLTSFIVLALNAVSYMLTRRHWRKTGRLGVTFKHTIINNETDRMIFRLGGCRGQADTAFAFLNNFFRSNDVDVTDVMFHTLLGFDLKTITDQTLAEIRKYPNRKRLVMGISIGDYVARCAEEKIPTVRTIPFNPEPHWRCLKTSAYLASVFADIFLHCVGFVLGWLNFVFIHKECGHWYSIIYLADQFHAIVTADASYTSSRTLAVIGSYYDQFLNNSLFKVLFHMLPASRIFFAATNHANTVKYANAYTDAWRTMMTHVDIWADISEIT